MALILLVLLLLLLFGGLGFVSHLFWLGLLIVAVLAVVAFSRRGAP